MIDYSKFRQELHRYPEISEQEDNTARTIKAFFQKYHPEGMIYDLVDNSFVVQIKGQNKQPSIMFRCELDALPIQEKNDIAHLSKLPGKAHLCGHDGHMTVLLKLASLLENIKNRGDVYLLFQHGEENGAGAQAIMKTGFEQFQIEPDYIFALHNVPGFKMNEVVVKDAAFTPNVVSIHLDLIGKTAHAAEPFNGVNPQPVISEICEYFNSFHHPESGEAFFISTPIHIQMGTKDYGISAGHGELDYTFRFYEASEMSDFKAKVERFIKLIAEKHQIELQINWLQEFTSIVNDEGANQIITQATKALKLPYHSKPYPFNWGEDFGLYLTKYKGAMFGLGAGENTPHLHAENYDFPDELIESGAAMFAQIIKEICR